MQLATTANGVKTPPNQRDVKHTHYHAQIFQNDMKGRNVRELRMWYDDLLFQETFIIFSTFHFFAEL